jgi:sulfatase modifying factor 1
MKRQMAVISTLLFLVIACSPTREKERISAEPSLARELQSSNNACPRDMIEIEGNYCPEVVQACLNVDKSVHNVNGYVRCLEFAKTRCLTPPAKLVPMHFCMDKFEWPNREGEKPSVMVSWNDMKKNCASEDKRICQDHEWSLACEGPEILPYPYGYKRDTQACNIDNPQKPGFDASKATGSPEEVAYLDQRVISGSMPACVSPYGVYDMTGNVDESVVNSNHGQPMDSNHPEGKKQYYSAEMGGHWVKGARNRCRPKTTVHDESVVFYEIGGRCCKDVP